MNSAPNVIKFTIDKRTATLISAQSPRANVNNALYNENEAHSHARWQHWPQKVVSVVSDYLKSDNCAIARTSPRVQEHSYSQIDDQNDQANQKFLMINIAMFSCCTTVLSVFTLLVLAGVTSPNSARRFECAFSAASCAATAVLYWRMGTLRRLSHFQGYVDGANSIVESQRNVTWMVNFGMLIMISVSLRGPHADATLYASSLPSEQLHVLLGGLFSMISASLGWSSMNLAMRRAYQGSNECLCKYDVLFFAIGGGAMVLLSITSAASLQSHIRLSNANEHQMVHGQLQHNIHWWVTRVTLFYPLFTILSVTIIGIASFSHTNSSAKCYYYCLDALSCVLGAVVQSRARAGYAQMALVDNMHLQLQSLPLARPANSVIHQQMIIDTLGCVLDLVAIGGTALACTILSMEQSNQT